MEINISDIPSSYCKKTICLNMIVKNESSVIIETFKN